MISYRAVPASYEVLQSPATRSGGEAIDGGELPEVVIIGDGGGSSGGDSGGGYGGGGYSGGGDGGYTGGSGGGGGGTGGSNPPPQNNPPPTTPCEFMSTMQGDTSFNSNILNYYQIANDDALEDGYIKRSNGSLQLPVNRTTGSLGYGSNYLQGKYTERLHTHPMAAGGSPYFSAEDIVALNQMYVGNHLEGVSSFRYMVATPYGIIVLQISDETKYTTFANTYSTTGSVTSLRNVMNGKMVYVGTVEVITQSFLNFLNSSNSGLSFVIGDVVTDVEDNSNIGINWNVKEIQNNAIQNKTCN
jgi:hypothetical protein